MQLSVKLGLMLALQVHFAQDCNDEQQETHRLLYAHHC